ILSVKGFLVAGYNTTTDISSYIFILFNKFLKAVRKLREKHNCVFDKNINKTIKLLQSNLGLIKKLEYTTAVIFKTLRMFFITFKYKGQMYFVKNQVFSLLVYLIYYDFKYFDDFKVFKLKRFIKADLSFLRNGYRLFKKSLRACLGQALTINEIKIILLIIVRYFNFELKGHKFNTALLFIYTNLNITLNTHAF
ncbi:cytochrome P450, partial [Cadophora sp. DSE1049]